MRKTEKIENVIGEINEFNNIADEKIRTYKRRINELQTKILNLQKRKSNFFTKTCKENEADPSVIKMITGGQIK